MTREDELMALPGVKRAHVIGRCEMLQGDCRKGIGIEIDPDYFDIACKRVEEAYRKPDPVHPARTITSARGV